MNEREFTRRFPNASRSAIAANAQVSDPEPERDEARPLERSDAGEKESLGRVRVRFTGYRVRPLDPDNFAGSCKDLLDGLRHAHLIRGDEPWRIIFETEQFKVKHFSKERTEIEITYPLTAAAGSIQ